MRLVRACEVRRAAGQRVACWGRSLRVLSTQYSYISSTPATSASTMILALDQRRGAWVRTQAGLQNRCSSRPGSGHWRNVFIAE
jgi:hypothetical protein